MTCRITVSATGSEQYRVTMNTGNVALAYYAAYMGVHWCIMWHVLESTGTLCEECMYETVCNSIDCELIETVMRVYRKQRIYACECRTIQHFSYLFLAVESSALTKTVVLIVYLLKLKYHKENKFAAEPHNPKLLFFILGLKQKPVITL